MTSGQAGHVFASATAVWADGDGRYRGEIRPGWDVVGNTNGGYLMALAARAASGAAGGRAPVTATAHFLARSGPGPVIIDTTVFKRGRRLTTVGATVAVEGAEDRALMRLRGSFGDDLAGSDSVEMIAAEPPELPRPAACVRFEPGDPFPPALMGRLELRLHPEDATFGAGRPRIRGWLRLLNGEPVDAFGLILATDVCPPTAFNARLPVAWVPTVELTAHVRSRPEPGWLRCQFITRHISGGLLEEDGEVWDDAGRLVAQSRQLALVPSGASHD